MKNKLKGRVPKGNLGSHRKAISPVVATVLLIMIVIIIAILIILWARMFLGEKVEKFGKPAEYACNDVKFDAQISGSNIDIINKGNVPIYSLEIHKIERGSRDIENVNVSLGMGVSNSKTATEDLEQFEKVIIVPQVLGKTRKTRKNKVYTCDESFGIPFEFE